jgi:hypothetical protein
MWALSWALSPCIGPSWATLEQTMYTTSLDLTADIIDVRDIIERVEELEELQEQGEYLETPDCEMTSLRALLADLAGNGGDEQWRGDWYPVTLIRDSHFTDYAQELCEDIGDVPRDLPHYIAIDWEVTARNIRMDYTPTEINGVTYWYR